MYSIQYLPLARDDFDQSFDWYACRSTVAATRFADAVAAVMERISIDPRRLTFVDAVHQECSLRHFPFRVIFRHLDDHVLIVAISHAKRRPAFWRGRK